MRKITLVLALVLGSLSYQAYADTAILSWDAPHPLTEEVHIHRTEAQADGTCPTAPQGYQEVTRVVVPQQSFTDTGLEIGKKYCWYASSWAQNVPESGPSEVASKIIPLPAPASFQAQ